MHSDVGGSYPEPTSGLSKIALEWMLVEAKKAGLEIEDEKARVVLGECRPKSEIDGLPKFAIAKEDEEPHKSLKGAWWLLELLPQQDPHLHAKRWHFPLGHAREIPGRSLIHESVFLGKQRTPALKDHEIEPWVRF